MDPIYPMDPARARRLLGVDSDASRHEIEQAFRRLARAHHPDHGGQSERFHSLLAARQTLTRALTQPPKEPLIVVVAPHRRLLRGLRALVWRHVLHSEPPRRVE